MSIAPDSTVARQFIYRFDELRQSVPSHPSARIHTSELAGSGDVATPSGIDVVAISGQRVQVALVRMAAGVESEVFTSPNEQFHYVLQGELMIDIDGRIVSVPQQHAGHIPARMPHRILTGAGSPVLLYSVQDAGTAFALPPAAGDDRRIGSRAQTSNVTGRDVRYTYAIGELDSVPEGALSVTVTPRNYISKKSTSFGAALSGERVHVAVIGKVRATGTKLHTHPNEQFSFVLQGQCRYEIEGQTAEALKGSVTHIPPETVHGVVAYPEEDVLTFVAKDTSHGMSGPPIDGKEDGPTYWPGFDPRNR